MEDVLMKGALKEGFFALLFVGLLLYQMKENRTSLNKAEERENRLISFIEGMKEEFTGLTRQFERLSDQFERLSDDVEAMQRQIDKRL
jgi:uncharacterized protein YoxC